MSRRKARSQPRPASPRMEEIEPRILYSADVLPDAPATEVICAVEDPAEPNTTETESCPIDDDLDQDILVLGESGEPIARQSATEATDIDSRVELLIIDPSIPDYQQLITGLDADENRYSLLVLQPGIDALSQITIALAEQPGIDALHIISHGDDARLHLGDLELTTSNLADYRDVFKSWSAYLADDADLMFYGCNLAESSQGTAMMELISLWTGADVAASTDITGHDSLGGDWDLEYKLGTIESEIAIATTTQQDWLGTLAEGVAGSVASEHTISETSGNLSATLEPDDLFGRAIASIGDLNQDGVGDMVVAASRDDDGGSNHGAVYVLFMNADGSVASEQKISDTVGGFAGTLDADDLFGRSVTAIGDLDNDGVTDIAVGAHNDDDGGDGRGAVYVLFMNPDGTVKAEQKISDTQGGLSTALADGSLFGLAVAGIGDLDNDGIEDLAVGASRDADGGTNRGAVYILFLNTDGTVKAEQKISDLAGGLTATLADNDNFGSSLANIGDLNNDGNTDLAVGALLDDDGGTDRGAVYVLFMNSNGTVSAERKISDSVGGLTATLEDSGKFSDSLAGIGDVDGDGNPDIAVGASTEDDGGTDRGAVHVLFLNADGSVKAEQTISSTGGDLTTPLDDSDQFGAGLAGIGDFDNDGNLDIVVGATKDDDGGADIGAVHVLGLETIPPAGEYQVNTTTGGTQETSGENRGSENAVAMDAKGNYVVVWSDSVNDGSGYGIFAQRFSSAGVKLGNEFQINETTGNNQYWASVAMAANGDFAITWTSVNQDLTPSSIYARLYAADGTPQAGGEFQVSTQGSGTQSNSSIAMADDGRFVIVWEGEGSGDSDGIFYRRYAADGSARDASDQLANMTDLGAELNPSVDMNANGEFVIAWQQGTEVYYRLFNDDGSAVFDDINLNDRTWDVSLPDIALNDSTEFVVAIRVDNSSFNLLDGSYYIRYDSAGAETGNPKGIKVGSNDDATSPSIEIDNDGNVIATFESDDDGSGQGIYARFFDASDNAPVTPFLVNETTTNDQQMASLAMLDIDNFVVAWSGEGSGDTSGVFARQYSFTRELTVDTASDVNDGDTSSIDALIADTGTDGLISLREAIIAANNTANGVDPDKILFDISGTGPHVISVASALPVITDAIEINGMTEPDHLGSPIVEINGASAGDVNGLEFTGGDGSIIKGLSITGFDGATNGIAIYVNGPDDFIIQGNYIGVKTDGVTADGNRTGIDIKNNADDNLIGGTTASERNVISGNEYGISISGNTSMRNAVLGNYIGVNADSSADLGNTSYGILVWGDSKENDIGGINAGEGNLIKGNRDGVVIIDAATTKNSIRGNQIYGNTESNFALNATDSVTGNDGDDTDTGPNNLQNYPELSSAEIGGANITITGTLQSLVSANTYDIDFYAASAAAANNHGGAEIYIGSATVTTDASGLASISEVLTASGVNAGDVVTATATDASGNTSEFATNVSVSAAPDIQQALLFSTEKDVTSGPDIGAWSSGTVVQLGDPNLALEPGTTSGTVSSAFDVDSFAALNGDGDTRVGSLHYVSQAITIAGSYNLQAGDILFSVRDNETLTHSDNVTTLSVTKNDVVVFRPDDTANYAAGGTFEILLEDPAGVEIRGLSLVEQDTWVGDAQLSAGTFLIAVSGGADDSNIFHITPTGVGVGTTTIAETAPGTLLIDGADIGISAKVMGLELVEQDSALGGTSLSAGSILVTLDNTATVGTNGISVTEYDVFSLAVTTTGSGTTAATATPVLEGTDLGLDTATASPFSLALLPGSNEPPVITSNAGGATAAVAVDENSTAVTTATATDADLDTPTYSITGGSDAASFSIDHVSGELTFVSAPDFEAPADANGDNVYEVQLTASDGNGGIDTQAISVTINNVAEAYSGNVTIDDTTPMRGFTLTASHTIVEPDGIPGSISWQWQRDGSNIAAATSTTYTPVEADIGTVLTVSATYTDGSGTTQTVTSAATSPVVAGYFLDEFNTIAYNGDDGTLSWNNDWQEETESDGANAGKNTVSNAPGNNALIFAKGSGAIWRSVDLTGATSAVLTLDLARINIEAEDSIKIQVSNDGFTTWGELVIGGPANDSSYLRISADMTPYISSDTRIRFVPTTDNGNDAFYIDNVRIDVNTLNDAPTADASAAAPYAVNEGDSLTLDASASSDADGDILQYRWDLNGDNIYGDVLGATPTIDWATLASFGINDDGSYTSIGLEVDDGRGGRDVSTTTVTVENAAPNLLLTGSGTIIEGSVYTLNLSATDSGNDTITQWTINWGDGNVETFAGNPSSVTHSYTGGGVTYDIQAVAQDEDGQYTDSQFIVPSSLSNSVKRYDAITGSFIDNFQTGVGLTQPNDILFTSDGYAYVTSETSNNVLRFDASSGAFDRTFVASGSGGLSTAGGIAIGPDGNLYVASFGSNSILRYDIADGSFINAFVSNGSGGLTGPEDIVFHDDGYLYVTSSNNSVLRYNASSGAFHDVFVTTAANGGLSNPEGLNFLANGDLLLGSGNTDNVLRFEAGTGAFLGEFISSTPGGLDSPSGVVIGPDGHLYVGSSQNDQILRYDGTTGAFIDTFVSSGNGLDWPSMIAFLPQHQVTVLARGNMPATAVSDNYSVDEDNTLNADVVSGLLANDIDVDGDGFSIVDHSDPLYGSLILNADGSFTYTPDAHYVGSDRFTYRIDDGLNPVQNAWDFSTDLSDSNGSADGSLGSASLGEGVVGNGLALDGSSYATLPDLSYGNEYTLSLWFKLDDNAGSGYDYLYSHGSLTNPNSLGIFFIEDSNFSASTQDVLRTRLLDSNDTDDMTALDIDVSANHLADGHWHQYTLSVSSARGSEVYIDGVLKASATNLGGDAMNPTGGVDLGWESTYAGDRYLEGSIDELQLWSSAASATEVASLYQSYAHVDISINPVDDNPTSVGIADFSTIENSPNRVIDLTAVFDDIEDGSANLVYSISANSNPALITTTLDQAADTLTLSFASDTTGTSTVTIMATDSSGGQVQASFTVSVLSMEGVTHTVPVSETLLEDGNAVFSSANGNAIDVSLGTVSDDLLRVSLAVDQGTLTLAGTTGISFESGSDTSAGMVIIGLESDLNAALDGLVYQPDAHFNGSATLQVTTDMNAGLQGQFTFSNPTDPAEDSSSSGLVGSVVGGVVGVLDPERDDVAQFDGTDVITVNSTFGDSSSITVSTWVSLDAGAQDAEVILIGNGVGLRLDDTANGLGVTGYFEGSATRYTNSGTTLAGSGWHHVAYVLDGNNTAQHLYIDGVEVASTGYADAVVYSDTISTIGGRSNVPQNLFVGELDNLRIYNRALNAEEIGALAIEQSEVSDAVALSVTSVNDIPTGNLANIVVDEDAANSVIDLHAAFEDIETADGDLLYTIESNSNSALVNATIDPASGNLTLSYSADGFGSATLTVRASDANNDFADVVFNVTVNSVNDAPVLTSPATKSIAENSAAVMTLGASDTDNAAGSLRFSIVGGADAALFSVDSVSGTLSFKNAPDFESPSDANADNRYDIVLEVSDGISEGTLAMQIHVANVDEKPAVITALLPGSFTEDMPLSLAGLIVQEPENQPIELTLRLANPNAGVISSIGASAQSLSPLASAGPVWTAQGTVAEISALMSQLYFIPATNYADDIELLIEISDGNGPAESRSKFISGIAVADPPSVGATIIPAGETTAQVIIARNTDDGDEVRFFRITAISNGTLTLSDGVTPISEGAFIPLNGETLTLAFTANSTLDGSFVVESSADGLTVSPQSKPVTATVSVQTTAVEKVAEPVESSPEPTLTKTDQPSVVDIPSAVVMPPVTSVEKPTERTADMELDNNNTLLVAPKRSEGVEMTGRGEVDIRGVHDVFLQRYQDSNTPLLVQIMLENKRVTVETLTAQSFEHLISAFTHMDEATEKLLNNEIGAVGSAVTVATGLSVGYVVWMVRGGMLMSSLLFSLPAWQVADPLPILNAARKPANEDDESLETIIERRAKEDERNNRRQPESTEESGA